MLIVAVLTIPALAPPAAASTCARSTSVVVVTAADTFLTTGPGEDFEIMGARALDLDGRNLTILGGHLIHHAAADEGGFAVQVFDEALELVESFELGSLNGSDPDATHALLGYWDGRLWYLPPADAPDHVLAIGRGEHLSIALPNVSREPYTHLDAGVPLTMRVLDGWLQRVVQRPTTAPGAVEYSVEWIDLHNWSRQHGLEDAARVLHVPEERHRSRLTNPSDAAGAPERPPRLLPDGPEAAVLGWAVATRVTRNGTWSTSWPPVVAGDHLVTLVRDDAGGPVPWQVTDQYGHTLDRLPDLGWGEQALIAWSPVMALVEVTGPSVSACLQPTFQDWVTIGLLGAVPLVGFLALITLVRLGPPPAWTTEAESPQATAEPAPASDDAGHSSARRHPHSGPTVPPRPRPPR